MTITPIQNIIASHGLAYDAPLKPKEERYRHSPLPVRVEALVRDATVRRNESLNLLGSPVRRNFKESNAQRGPTFDKALEAAQHAEAVCTVVAIEQQY